MEKNKLLNIIGFFRIPFQAISHTPDGYEIVHIYNQEASKIFYSGEFIPISEHSMFIMQKMDGNKIISEAIPIRVVSVQEYTVDDKGFIKSLIMKVTEDVGYFDRTFTGTSTPIYPFGEYVQVDDAVAIEARGCLDTLDKVNLFAAAHPFISVDNEPYMFCRSGAYTVINTTIYVPTMDDNVTVPCSKHIVISTIMVYTKKAAYNSKNAQFAEKTLEKILKKKYEGIE